MIVSFHGFYDSPPDSKLKYLYFSFAAAFVSSLISVLGALVLGSIFNNIGGNFYNRITGLGAASNPNPYADYLMINIIMGVCLLGSRSVRMKQTSKYILSIILVFMTVAFFMTGSRGAILGLMVSFLYMWYVGIGLKYGKYRIISFFGILLVFIMRYTEGVIENIYHLVVRFRNLENPFPIHAILSDSPTLTGRPDIYTEYLKVFSESPLLGEGFGWYSDVVGVPRSAHNIFLHISSEAGIVGIFVLIIIIIFSLLKSLQRGIDHANSVNASIWVMSGASLVAMITHGLFENTIVQVQNGWFLGVLFGLVWGSGSRAGCANKP
jgi:O-antigen ligase